MPRCLGGTTQMSQRRKDVLLASRGHKMLQELRKPHFFREIYLIIEFAHGLAEPKMTPTMTSDQFRGSRLRRAR